MMNDLTTLNPVETMSSKEIAELTGKEHFHVLRDIDNMVYALKKDDPNLDHEEIQGVTFEKDGRGYTAAAHLNKELTYTLITGYSVVLRNKVVQRWQELEAKHQLSPMEMVIKSAQAILKVEREQALLKQQQAEQADTLKRVEARQEMTEKGFHDFTVLAYAGYRDMPKLDLKTANKLGRKAAKHCRDNGYPIGSIRDPRFGKVNTYPEEVLDTIFKESFEF